MNTEKFTPGIMNIDITITEEKHIQKEINTPYYAQDVCYFLMITKNETIIRVKGASIVGAEIEMLVPDDCCYNQTLVQAVTAKEISESTFMDRFNEVHIGIIEALKANPTTVN